MGAVITFHSVDESRTVLSYLPRSFETFLADLHRAKIPILPLKQLLRSNGHGVALAFDDGMSSVFSAALPALRRFDAHASLFLTTDAVGKDNRWPGQPGTAPHYQMLTWAEVRELQSAGVSIEAHTASHPDLRQLTDSEIEKEFDRSDEAIADQLGRRPRFLAYPYGYHDARVRALASHRYEACLTTELNYLPACVDRAAIPRLDSYYLRTRWISRNLFRGPVRTYLGVRRLARAVRGRG